MQVIVTGSVNFPNAYYFKPSEIDKKDRYSGTNDPINWLIHPLDFKYKVDNTRDL